MIRIQSFSPVIDERARVLIVISSCEREGSLDVNIRGEVPNDIPGLLEKYPNIVCIACNGSKSHDTLKKYFSHHDIVQRLTVLKLPL